MAELSDRTRRLARISMCNRAAADELTGEVETAMALTATEIGYVDAITPGTVAVSKAVIVAADGAIDALTFDSASTALTISAAATRGLYAGHVGTTACHFLDMIDAYTGMIIETGTYASAASKGVTLSASNPRPVTFVADDGGALLGAGNYRGVLSRVYVAETQTGQIALRAMRGQVKVATTKNLTIGTNEMNAVNGVEGYIELAGTHTIGANTRVAAVHGYVEVTDDVTLTTGGKLVGLYAELGQVTAKTVSGIGTCGILVDRLDSDHSTHQAAWTTGLVIADSATTTALKVGICTTGLIMTGVTGYAIDIVTSGQFRMGTADVGIPTLTATPYGMEVHTETGAVAIAPIGGGTGITCGLRCRYQVSVAQTETISFEAVDARLRVKANMADGVHCGVNGTIESDGGITFTGAAQRSAGVFTVELGQACVFTGATGSVCGVTIDSSIHATQTAIANVTLAGLRIKKSSGKLAWTHGIYLDDASATTGITLGTTTTAIAVGVCTTGLIMTGVTGYAIDIVTSGQLRMGTADIGIPTATATPYAMEVHAQTNSSAVIAPIGGGTGITCGLRCRYHVSKAQTEIISFIAVEGRLRVKAAMDDGCHAGVSGTIEADAAMGFTGTAETQRSAGNFCVELGSTCVFGTTSGWLCGVTIDSSVHGTQTGMANIEFCGLRIKKSGGKLAFEHAIYLDASCAGVGITFAGACTTGINVVGNSVIPQFITSGDTTDPVHWDGVASHWLVHTENIDTTPASVTAHKFVLDAAHSAATTSGRLECFRAETRSYSTNNISGSLRALVGQVTFSGDCTYVGAGPQGCCALIGAVHSGSNLTATGDVFALGLMMGVETSSAFNGKSAFIYCYGYGKVGVESLIYLDCNVGNTSNMTYFLDCDGLDLASHHDFFSDDAVNTDGGDSDGCIKIRLGSTVYEIPIFAE